MGWIAAFIVAILIVAAANVVFSIIDTASELGAEAAAVKAKRKNRKAPASPSHA